MELTKYRFESIELSEIFSKLGIVHSRLFKPHYLGMYEDGYLQIENYTDSNIIIGIQLYIQELGQWMVPLIALESDGRVYQVGFHLLSSSKDNSETGEINLFNHLQLYENAKPIRQTIISELQKLNGSIYKELREDLDQLESKHSRLSA